MWNKYPKTQFVSFGSTFVVFNEPFHKYGRNCLQHYHLASPSLFCWPQQRHMHRRSTYSKYLTDFKPSKLTRQLHWKLQYLQHLVQLAQNRHETHILNLLTPSGHRHRQFSCLLCQSLRLVFEQFCRQLKNCKGYTRCC